MADIQYRWSIDDEQGQYVNIESLPQDKRGKGYSCTFCNQPMMARIGDVRQRHFAHIGEVRGECTPETAEHWMAKRWFEERVNAINYGFPPLVIEGPCMNSDLFHNGGTAFLYCIAAEGLYVFNDNKSIPVPRGTSIQPDVLITTPDGEMLAVEIERTNPVSEKKRLAYEAAGIQGVIFRIKADADIDRLYDQLGEGRVVVDDTINVSWLCFECARDMGCYILGTNELMPIPEVQDCFQCRDRAADWGSILCGREECWERFERAQERELWAFQGRTWEEARRNLSPEFLPTLSYRSKAIRDRMKQMELRASPPAGAIPPVWLGRNER